MKTSESRLSAGVELLSAMRDRFRSKRNLHPRWTTGGVMTLLGAAADATAALLDSRELPVRARNAVDAANYLSLAWMDCFGWRLYLAGSEYGPEAGVGLFGLRYLDCVSRLDAVPTIGEVPLLLESLGRVAAVRGREAEVERVVVVSVASLADVYQVSQREEHPLVKGRVRAVVEHVIHCARCRERYRDVQR